MDARTERASWIARNILPHEPTLRSWLLRNARAIDIDDVVQESYARLATLPSIEHILNPRTYLFQTAISVVRQDLRRARVVDFTAILDVDRLEIAANDVPVDRAAEARQELRNVIAAIDELPERCREVFMLRRMQGLSQREIATRLGISENTVEKHIGRGLRHLAEWVANGGKPVARASSDDDNKNRRHVAPRSRFHDR